MKTCKHCQLLIKGKTRGLSELYYVITIEILFKMQLIIKLEMSFTMINA